MAETTTTSTVGTIGGYSIVRREPLETLEGSFLELEHQRTGARHVHIECTDDNNAFAVFFPTTPKDSTGVAHILEHVVLAGSQRFPVRDPFFSMTRRSLATFMNAFTSADWTMYPFSTRNAKDFMNLLDVYLDATFFPRLAEDSFKQEGIRFEFEAPEDPKSGLRYKGVVFNEMKGALASPQAAMQRAVGKALFPGLTYEHISGGDPENIPDLTWQKLRDFHAVHYHPSNAYFYTYGNQPLEMTLEAIERNVLSRFERIKVDTEIPDVARFKRPTKALQDALAAGGAGMRMLALDGAVPVEGGVPLIADGKIVGAIGVSGDTSSVSAASAALYSRSVATEDFVSAIETNGTPLCDGVEGRRSLALVEATYEAAGFLRKKMQRAI